MRSSRSRVSTWLPALPPKMPYSCCTQATSTSLTFRKSPARRVVVVLARVVHGEHEAVEIGADLADRATQIRGERGDSALPRGVVADDGDLSCRFDGSSDR